MARYKADSGITLPGKNSNISMDVEYFTAPYHLEACYSPYSFLPYELRIFDITHHYVSVTWWAITFFPGGHFKNRWLVLHFLAATKQLLEHFCPSVRLYVRPSVTPFHYVPIIVSSWNFQEVLPMTKSDVHAKDQGQRSKVKVTEVKTQLSRFRTVTPV